jgi:phospholipid/cholesterol/gamma-HCH transport system substrate-binding protein
MENDKPSKHSKRNAKSIKVAIFCILALVILYFGANYLKGIDTFSKKEFYYSVYENSGGLYEGAIVYLQGYPVGKVTKVKLKSSNPVQILAEYVINEKFNIPIDSRFDVTSRDMLGGTIVKMTLGTSTRMAKSGDTLTCGMLPQFTDGLDAMKGQIGNILASVDTLTVSLKDLFSSENKASKLTQTLCNIESVTASLDKILANNEALFGKIVTEIAAFSKTLNELSPELKNMVAHFDQIADTIAKANVAEIIVNANNTIIEVAEVVKKLNSGNGDVAKLLNNDEIYTKLGNSLQSLDELLIDIKKNPKKYVTVTVFGKKEKK